MGFSMLISFIILVYGAYSMYTAKKMKKDGQPPQWLMNPSELMRVRQPRQFCEEMYGKTFGFGLICVLYGLFRFVLAFFSHSAIIDLGSIVVLVVVIIWFVATLQKTKQKYV